MLNYWLRPKTAQFLAAVECNNQGIIMNFLRDPLLDKLRIIEARTLSEALSDDEFADLQKLRAELADDPESQQYHAQVDAIIRARAAELEKPSPAPNAEPPAPAPAPNEPKPEEKPSAKWPTTTEEIKAFQRAHNLKDDGLIGQKTMAALIAAGATPPPGFKPVGNKVKPTDKPSTGQAGQPDTMNTMSRRGTPPELAKVDPRVNPEYWVNGTRYKFTGIGANGTWAPNFEKGDWIGTPQNKKLSADNYTGPVPGAGAQPKPGTTKPAAKADYDSSTY